MSSTQPESMTDSTTATAEKGRYRSALPSKEERVRKHDPFGDAEPVLSTKPEDGSLEALSQAQEQVAEAWRAMHESDAERRERVLRMKGCLEGQCCYMVPGKMMAGPTVYK